ncbi:19896_t:CDS:1 [Funneliformis geosporum]|nr:19896_t:CDS:1 [Funneliformis geosporum]
MFNFFKQINATSPTINSNSDEINSFNNDIKLTFLPTLTANEIVKITNKSKTSKKIRAKTTVFELQSHIATGDTGARSLEDPVMNSSGSSPTVNPNNNDMNIIARQQFIDSLERMDKKLHDILESTEYPGTFAAYQELIYDFQIVIESYHSGALSLEDPVMNSSGSSSTANPNNDYMNIIACQQRHICLLEQMNKNLRDLLDSTQY